VSRQVAEETLARRITRRALVLAGLGIGALGFLAPRLWRSGDQALSRAAPSAELTTLIAFVGTLFGRESFGNDADDLAERLNLLVSDVAMRHQCTVLAQYLDSEARSAGAADFVGCDPGRKEAIVRRIMEVEPRSWWARVSSKLSPERHDFYLMKEWTVPALAWLYRNSAAAWHARGYSRIPGVPGDWHEILTRGAPYP
jgi:hypothetical protein